MTRTNAYTLLCMIIRAVAVFTLATLAIGLPSIVVAMRNQPMAEISLTPVIVAMAIAVGVVVVLWLFADKLAKLALVRPQDQVFESDLDAAAWLGVAVSSIGAWQLFAGLKGLTYLVSKWLFLSSAAAGLGLDGGVDRLVPEAVTTIVQIVLALAFLLRGPGLARLFQRLRYGTEAT